MQAAGGDRRVQQLLAFGGRVGGALGGCTPEAGVGSCVHAW